MAAVIGKTIQIYLPDGNPRGIKVADITSRTVQTALIPRAQLDYACERPEITNVGVYFLVGDASEGQRPLVYVGEAEQCATRLKQHNKEKEFWSTALVVVSKTHHFTKTHVKYLEWHCHEQVQRVGRYRLDNPNIPTKPHTSEPMESDLLDNFDTLKVLVSALGYPLFDEIRAPSTEESLLCSRKKAKAKGEYTEEGLVVFKGSTAYLEETPSASDWVRRLRAGLMQSGVLEQAGATLRFTADYIFATPSAAAAVVLGQNANGWIEWKYNNGRTLDDVRRRAT